MGGGCCAGGVEGWRGGLREGVGGEKEDEELLDQTH